MNYNPDNDHKEPEDVVVWCRNRMNYNGFVQFRQIHRLWFDVEIEWITTDTEHLSFHQALWFDVEIEIERGSLQYDLSKEEIDYIESMIKPMGEDALFNTDELINPEFASFNLLEHGVSIGDKIIYTPTGTELTVAEDNKVECNGELYTLAEFTAKHMPRNKRSVSGLCQGPKYFSFNGVSLYKLKESFLKKK